MNFKPLYAWIVLFPLLVGACGGSKDNPELPPPGPQPEKPQPGSNPWDANRGKKVQPSGAGWTSTVIDEGSVSNAPQRIFVTDVDLSKSQYEFKLEYYSGRSTASNVFATKNAIAVINGGYERGSIVIWKDGQKYSTMPDNTISDTGVPNWKSEAAVYMDNKRDVRIEFSGKGMSITQQHPGADGRRSFPWISQEGQRNALSRRAGREGVPSPCKGGGQKSQKAAQGRLKTLASALE